MPVLTAPIVSATVVKKCWEGFKTTHGERHLEILETFDDMNGGLVVDMTVAKREKLFQKLCNDFAGMVILPPALLPTLSHTVHRLSRPPSEITLR